jgi:hypothetical protein
VDPDVLGDLLVTLPQVTEVHDLHVWQVTSGQTALSAHVLVDPGSDCHALRRDIEHVLTSDYAITHSTLRSTTPARHPCWGPGKPPMVFHCRWPRTIATTPTGRCTATNHTLTSPLRCCRGVRLARAFGGQAHNEDTGNNR